MNKFIKFGGDYINPRFIKQTKFNDDECSLIIANTQVISAGGKSYEYLQMSDQKLTIRDRTVCDEVKRRFEKYYGTIDY